DAPLTLSLSPQTGRGNATARATTRVRLLSSGNDAGSPSPRERGEGRGEGLLRGSIQPVEAHRAAGENAFLRRRRGALEPLPHHVRCAREKAVAVRVVGRPH